VAQAGRFEDLNQAEFDREVLEFVYPYERSTVLPSKVTATQLKGRGVDAEIAENAAHVPYIRPLSQPKFRQEHTGLTPAERGTAIHLALQYLDVSNMDVAGQVQAMEESEKLTPTQAQAVDIACLEHFLTSDIAGAIRRSDRVLREYRFTMLMDAAQYDPNIQWEENILLQGVVDCCFETDGVLTVVDFKTDQVQTEWEIRRRAETYRPQLEAYSRALEQILEKKVVRKVLYFLTPGVEIEL